jgi:hypothetical protein
MSLWDDYRRLVQQQTIDRPLYEQVQQPSAPSWDAPAAQPAQDYLSQISNPFAEAANNEATEAAKAAEKAAEEKRVLDLEARREQNKKITLDQLKAMNPADKQAYWNSMNEEENGRTAEIANARREGTTRSIGELYDLYNGARDVSEFRSQLIADKQNQGAGLNPVQAVASGAQGALDKAADNLKFFRNEQGDAVNADLSNPGTILPGLANAVTSFFPSMASAVPKAVNDIAASATGASIDNEAASENFNKNGYINLQDLTARGSSATERGANAASSALDILGMIPQAKAGVVAARGAQVVGGVARKAIGAGLKAGMAEGLTEGAQSLLDAHGSGVDITGGQVGGAALTGFLLGGGVGGGLTAVGGIRGNRSAARASANSGAANSGVDISGTAAETDTTGADFQATGAPEITTGTPATQIASNMAQPLEAGFGMNPTTPQNIAEAYEANRAPAPVEEVVNDFMTRNPEATPAQIAEVQNIAAQVDPTYVPEAAQPQQTIAPEAIRAQMATPEVTTPAADISNRVAEITPRVAENLPNNAAPVAENLPNNAAPVAPQNRVMSTENANGTIEVEYMSPDNQIETQTFDNHEEARNFVENDMGQDYNQSFEAPEQTTAAPETDYIRNPQNRPAEPGAHRAASPVEPRATQGRSNGAQNTSRANTQEASENASVAATEPQSANNSGRSRSGSQSSQNSTDARPGVQQAASNRTAESYAEIDRTLREHYGALDDAQIRTDLRNTAAEDGATFTMEEFRVIEQIVQERNIRFSSILGNPMETLRARAESYTSQAGRTLRFARIRTQQAIMNGEATRTQFIEEMTRNVPSGLTITPEFQSVIDAAADTYVEAANAYTRTKDQLSALTRNFEQGGGIIDPKAMTELTDTVRFLYNEMKQSARVSDIAILEEINSSGLPKKTTRAMKTEFAYNQLRSRGI